MMTEPKRLRALQERKVKAQQRKRVSTAPADRGAHTAYRRTAFSALSYRTLYFSFYFIFILNVASSDKRGWRRKSVPETEIMYLLAWENAGQWAALVAGPVRRAAQACGSLISTESYPPHETGFC